MLLAIALELFKRKAGFPVGENNSSDKSHLGIEGRYGNVDGKGTGDIVDSANCIFEVFGIFGMLEIFATEYFLNLVDAGMFHIYIHFHE